MMEKRFNPDRSQDQDMSAMGGDGQQTQAGRDAIALQNSQMTINKSFIALFGGRSVAPGVDWDWAMKILKQQQPDLKKRLRESLFGLAQVDAVEVEARGQEASPALMLEAKKTLTVNGTEAGTIDADLPIIATYAREDIDGSLLILGTPGAGKTITLLKLADQLVGEAIVNPETVIPIVFELSTWREGQSIEAWLIEQLYENYGGKREWKVYETWLERRVLLPLLDGLDELGMVRQKACTEKVNAFAAQYPQVVVCCRVKEFQQAGVNLSNVRGKVQLQPLTDRQLEQYLQSMGKVGLWEQILSVPEMGKLLEPVIDKENADYDEPGLLRVPLFISLAAKVYEPGQPLKGKTDLFDRYIDRQLSWDARVGDRRKEVKKRDWSFKAVDQEPKPEAAKRSITWVARQLQRQGQVELLIEKMQPSWLDSNITKWQYRLIGGLIVGLIFGLIVGLIGGLKQDLKVRSHPNQGIWNSLQSTVFTMLFMFPGGIILTYFPRVISDGIKNGKSWEAIGALLWKNFPNFIIPGLLMTLFLGIFLGGGAAIVQHICLRIILTCHYPVPWNLAQFLTYGHERRLLQQIGGRYRFIHRELLEHFARMENLFKNSL